MQADSVDAVDPLHGDLEIDHVFAPGLYLSGIPGDVAKTSFGVSLFDSATDGLQDDALPASRKRGEPGLLVRCFASRDQGQGEAEVDLPASVATYVTHADKQSFVDFTVTTEILGSAPVRKLACGGHHVVVMTERGTLLAVGQVTSQHKPPRARLPQVLGGTELLRQPVLDVVCGSSQTLVLAEMARTAAPSARPGDADSGSDAFVYRWHSEAPMGETVHELAGKGVTHVAACGAACAAATDTSIATWLQAPRGGIELVHLSTDSEGEAGVAAPRWRGVADGVGVDVSADWWERADAGAGATRASAPVRAPRGLQVHQLAIGTRHVAVLSTDGQVWTWGANSYGLGHDCDDLNITLPRLVECAHWTTPVVAIACGARHIAAITRTAQLYAWGDNSHGQVGCGEFAPADSSTPEVRSVTRVATPRLIPLPDAWQVCCGDQHTAVLTVQGEVYSWGLESGDSRFRPQLRSELLDFDVLHIGCGPSYTAALLAPPGLYLVATCLSAGEPLPQRVATAPALPDEALRALAGAEEPAPHPSVTVPCKLAAFGSRDPLALPATRLVAAQPLDASSALSNGSAVRGALVLIQRGACSFADKARRAVAAGAAGIVFVNKSEAEADAVANTRVLGQCHEAARVPVVSVSASSGAALQQLLEACPEGGAVALEFVQLRHAREALPGPL